LASACSFVFDSELPPQAADKAATTKVKITNRTGKFRLNFEKVIVYCAAVQIKKWQTILERYLKFILT
jgi:hypothetical protein